MPDITDEILSAWQTASLDLGFEFVRPYYWLTLDGRRMTYLGLVKGFGRKKGTLLRIMQLGEFPGTVVLDDDFLIAKIGQRFAQYERSLWLKTLEEWSWQGAGPIPLKHNG